MYNSHMASCDQSGAFYTRSRKYDGIISILIILISLLPIGISQNYDSIRAVNEDLNYQSAKEPVEFEAEIFQQIPTYTATSTATNSSTPTTSTTATVSSTITATATITYTTTPTVSPTATSSATNTATPFLTTSPQPSATQTLLWTATITPTLEISPGTTPATATLLPLPKVTFQYPHLTRTVGLLVIEHPPDSPDLSKGGGTIAWKKLVRWWPLLIILGLWLILGFWFVFSQGYLERGR